METKEKKDGLDQFLGNEPKKEEIKKEEPAVKSKDGLLERVEVNRKLVVEDGRELLREITHKR